MCVCVWCKEYISDKVTWHTALDLTWCPVPRLLRIRNAPGHEPLRDCLIWKLDLMEAGVTVVVVVVVMAGQGF